MDAEEKRSLFVNFLCEMAGKYLTAQEDEKQEEKVKEVKAS